jgi:integrase
MSTAQTSDRRLRASIRQTTDLALRAARHTLRVAIDLSSIWTTSSTQVLNIAPSNGGTTLAALASWYLDHHADELRGGDRLRLMVRAYVLRAPIASRPIDSLNGAEMRSWLAALRGRRGKALSPRTRNLLRQTLRRMCKLGMVAGLCKRNPALDIERFKETRKETETLTTEELARLLDSLDWSWFCLVSVAAYTGLRRGEQLALTVDDVDVRTWELRVRESKNGEAARVPIHPAIRPVLLFLVAEARAAVRPWLFVAPGGERRSNKQTLAPKLREACAAVGIHKHLRWHDLRHTTGTLLVEGGAHQRAVQAILRHKTPSMTARYTHASNRGWLAEQMSKIS